MRKIIALFSVLILVLASCASIPPTPKKYVVDKYTVIKRGYIRAPSEYDRPEMPFMITDPLKPDTILPRTRFYVVSGQKTFTGNIVTDTFEILWHEYEFYKIGDELP